MENESERAKKAIDKLSEKQKKELLTNVLNISSEDLYYQIPILTSMARAANIDPETLKDEEVLKKTFPFKEESVNIMLSPIFENGLAMDVDDYKEYIECLNKISELTIKAYQRMAACPFTKPKVTKEQEEELNKIKGSAKFTFGVDKLRKQKETADSLKSFDINKFKK